MMPMIALLNPSRLPPGDSRFGPHVTIGLMLQLMSGVPPVNWPMYSRYSRNATIPPSAPATIHQIARPRRGRWREGVAAVVAGAEGATIMAPSSLAVGRRVVSMRRIYTTEAAGADIRARLNARAGAT